MKVVAVVLLLSQLTWLVTAFGVYWWCRPVLPETLRLRNWLIVFLLVVNGLTALAYFKTAPIHWRWLVTSVLLAFYGTLFVIAGAVLNAALKRLGSRAKNKATLMVRSASIIALAWLLGSGWYNAYYPQTKHYQVQLQRPLKQPLRIALISDTHFGSLIGHKHIGQLKRIVKQEKPDIILLAGDIMDDSPNEYQRTNMAAALRKVSAPLGQYAVLGNHDNYLNIQPEIVSAIQEGGFTVLRDESIEIDGRFILVGRRDKEEPRLSPRALMATLAAKNSLPVIVFDHQPTDIDSLAETTADLILVGHTHAGQIFPATLLITFFQKYIQGQFLVNQTPVVITAGLGLWGIPLRIGSRSEVAIVDVLN